MKWIADGPITGQVPITQKKPETVCRYRAAATYSKIEAPSATTSAIMA